MIVDLNLQGKKIIIIGGGNEAQKYTTEHDDTHIHDELAKAAATYAIPAEDREIYAGNGIISNMPTQNILKVLWPFDKASWKPTPADRIKELTKAGALIASEIDRLLRYEPDFEPTKIEWSPIAKPISGVSHYDHTYCKTPLGIFMIEWKSWKDQPSYGIELAQENTGPDYIGTEYSLEDAKKIVLEYLESRLNELNEFLNQTKS